MKQSDERSTVRQTTGAGLPSSDDIEPGDRRLAPTAATGAGAMTDAELREAWHDLEDPPGTPEAMWIAVSSDLTDATGPFLSDHDHALEVCTKLSLEFGTTWVPVRFTPAGRVRGGQLEVERSGRDGEAGRTRQTGGYL